MIDRTEASRALAKVIAYDNVGQDAKRDYWIKVLTEMLGATDVTE